MVRAENLGEGSGVTPEGDVLPIDDIEHEVGYVPEMNDDVVERASDIARRFAVEAGAVASNVTVDHEGTRRVYPKTAQEVVEARKALRAQQGPLQERTDAYAELGGGLRANREEEPGLALENVLDDDYEPWMLDVRLAVEQFGIGDFSVGELRAMKPDDFKKFSLYFYSFLQSIDIHKNLIIGVEGRTDVDSVLHDRYGSREPSEMTDYLNTLKWLKSDLEETGIPDMVRVEIGAPRDMRDNVERRNKLLQQVSLDKKKHHGQTLRVVRVKGKATLERADAV